MSKADDLCLSITDAPKSVLMLYQYAKELEERLVRCELAAEKNRALDLRLLRMQGRSRSNR